MKKFASVLFAILFCPGISPLYAEISVIKTDYFDIIYPEKSAETAQLLAEYADGFADEICLLFDSSMKKRIPVYVNPEQKDLNAYFTSYLYNRIVVYDALPVDGTLSGSRDTILKVFYHEMVHLVSLNVRTPFWQVMSGIFGDCVSINDAITMPLSFLEGATVSLESRDGEGRLNDPLFLHVIRQAKIDGDFPSFKDAAGARDVYPGKRMSYYFGGGFSAWLQQTRGMEKYAELWKRGGGFNPFMSWTWTRFLQVYGIPIETAWTQFRDSVTIPSRISFKGEPVSGAKLGILSSLASGPSGIVWSDANSGKVFGLDDAGKVRSLFDSDSALTRLSLSPDGSILLVSSFFSGERSTREMVRVFDMKRLRFTGESYENLRDAAFAGDNDSVCGIETDGQRASLVVFSRKTGRGSQAPRTVLANAGQGKKYDVFFSPVFVRDGTIACIGSSGQQRDIVFVDVATGSLSALSLPAGTGFIRYLNVVGTGSDRVLSFCWAGKDDMYRYGLYKSATGELVLQQENLSGGVFWPVVDMTGDGLFYVSSSATSDRLMHISLGGTSSVRIAVDAAPVPVQDAASGADSSAAVLPLVSSRYNPLPWFGQGVFYPLFGTMPKEDGSYIFGPSLTYLTEDPAENIQLYTSATFFTDPRFVEGSVNALFRTDAGRINLLASDQVMPGLSEYNPYRQVTTTLTFARTDYCDATWKKLDSSFTATAHCYAPDVENYSSVYAGPFDSGSLGGEAEFAYSELHTHSVPGGLFFPVIDTGFTFAADGFLGILRPDITDTSIVQSKFSVSFPFLPLSLTVSAASADGLFFTPGATIYTASCVREYVWDETQYYPLFPEYKGTVFADTQSSALVAGIAELMPFNLEIQKGIPCVPLYANRIRMVTGYRGAVFGIPEGTRTYIDSVYVKTSFEASAVIGILTNVLLSAEAEYAYPLRTGTGYVFLTFGAKVPL